MNINVFKWTKSSSCQHKENQQVNRCNPNPNVNLLHTNAFIFSLIIICIYLDLLALLSVRGDVQVAPLSSLLKRMWFPGPRSFCCKWALNTSSELVGDTLAWHLALFVFKDLVRLRGARRTECHMWPNKEWFLWN